MILCILPRANIVGVDSPYTPQGEYRIFSVLENTLSLEGNIERVDFQFSTFKNNILTFFFYLKPYIELSQAGGDCVMRDFF